MNNYPKYFEGRIKNVLDKSKMGRPGYISTYVKPGAIFGCFTVTNEEPIRLQYPNGKTKYYANVNCSCGANHWLTGVSLRLNQKSCRTCRAERREGIFKTLGKEMKYWHRYNYMLRKSAKVRGYDFNLTPEYLKELYDSQNGICAISGIPMTRELGNVSVDRIDNSKGYTIGNIQFADLRVNKIKFNMGMEEFLGVCRAIVKHNSK